MNAQASVTLTELKLIDCSPCFLCTIRQPTAVSFRYTELGERVRVSDRTGRVIPKPPWERRDWKERSVLKGTNKSGVFVLAVLVLSLHAGILI